jgi:hypothetical protein
VLYTFKFATAHFILATTHNFRPWRLRGRYTCTCTLWFSIYLYIRTFIQNNIYHIPYLEKENLIFQGCSNIIYYNHSLVLFSSINHDDSTSRHPDILVCKWNHASICYSFCLLYYCCYGNAIIHYITVGCIPATY